ncbi:hypothetical protein [Neptuniibacter sp. QD37_11]|uniref:hypothetical protein n=1 Tax=Neptuniibacter sp. QD37_11 TaxID=3398209 RepID=UPI0039F53D61
MPFCSKKAQASKAIRLEAQIFDRYRQQLTALRDSQESGSLGDAIDLLIQLAEEKGFSDQYSPALNNRKTGIDCFISPSSDAFFKEHAEKHDISISKSRLLMDMLDFIAPS